jgi:hypothetical protein
MDACSSLLLVLQLVAAHSCAATRATLDRTCRHALDLAAALPAPGAFVPARRMFAAWKSTVGWSAPHRARTSSWRRRLHGADDPLPHF